MSKISTHMRSRTRGHAPQKLEMDGELKQKYSMESGLLTPPCYKDNDDAAHIENTHPTRCASDKNYTWRSPFDLYKNIHRINIVL
jgi:hypothetical protein